MIETKVVNRDSTWVELTAYQGWVLRDLLKEWQAQHPDSPANTLIRQVVADLLQALPVH